MKSLFVSWRDPFKRHWHVVGRLSHEDGVFRYDYTRGAVYASEHGSFRAFPSFPDLGVTYESPKLFPFFSNRILPKGRPEYADFVRWISGNSREEDPIFLLGASGGRRQTDSDTLQLFPQPERNEQGYYEIYFFMHGSGHMPKASVERIFRLNPGDQLLICKDIQNPNDSKALILRTAGELPNDYYLVGFMPRYLAAELNSVLEGSTAAQVRVIRVNLPPAPVQFRVLCCLNFHSDVKILHGEEYQPINLRAQTSAAVSHGAHPFRAYQK